MEKEQETNSNEFVDDIISTINYEKLKVMRRQHYEHKYHHSRRDHDERENGGLPRNYLVARVILKDYEEGRENTESPLIEEINLTYDTINHNNIHENVKKDDFAATLSKEYGINLVECIYSLNYFVNHPFDRREMTRFAAEIYRHKRRKNNNLKFVDVVEHAEDILKSILKEKFESSIDDLVEGDESKRRHAEEDREQLTNYLLSNSEWDEDRHAERQDRQHRFRMYVHLGYGDGFPERLAPISLSEHRLKEHGIDRVVTKKELKH